MTRTCKEHETIMRRRASYVEVLGECAGLHDRLVEYRVVLPAKQDVVAHRSMLDPGLLGSQTEAALPAHHVDRPTQPGGVELEVSGPHDNSSNRKHVLDPKHNVHHHESYYAPTILPTKIEEQLDFKNRIE